MTHRPIVRTLRSGIGICVASCLVAWGCGSDGTAPDVPDDPGDVADAPDPGDPGGDPPDGGSDLPGDLPDTASDVPTDVGEFTWPVPTGPIAITPSGDWKNEVAYPDDPFLVREWDFQTQPEPPWVKFAVLMRDPSKVYFQKGGAFPFHYEFATQRLDPFAGMTREQFDAVSLHEVGQEVILGAMLYSPKAGVDEIGIQLVRQDPYHPEMVRRVFELVRDAVQAATPPKALYFPTYEQEASARAATDFFAGHGIEVSSAARWATGNECYSAGWAIGRLVEVPGSQIQQAYTSGALGPDDILLTDGVPAEVPFVAGILSTSPSTPNSHTAILSEVFGVPFAWLALPADVAAARARVGQVVALRAGSGNGLCTVRLWDAAPIPAADVAALKALKDVPVLPVKPKQALGEMWRSVDALVPAEIVHFGGKAANFGLLRQAIPNDSPAAAALSFDAWDAFLAQPSPDDAGKTLGQALAARLGGYAWPPDLVALSADLAWARTLIATRATIPQAVRDAVFAATEGWPRTTMMRFRSSTNVEDSASFVGAGLYDSDSGCPADDLDGDEVGPCACAPSKGKEHTALTALRTVYASFYNQNAFLERLRRDVDESKVGMGVLINASFPDADEMANGVATLRRAGGTSEMTLVTQKGATSVTNPEGGAVPERVYVTSSSWGTYPYVMERSSLVPLGGTVMDWESEYLALATLLMKVADRFAAVSGKTQFVLDLEFKKSLPGKLWVKQVRELPDHSKDPATGTYLVPTTGDWCTFQGEYGDVFGNHRLKSRWTWRTKGAWLGTAGPASTYLARVDATLLEGDGTATVGGDAATLPGAAHGFADGAVTDGFTVGEGAARRTLMIRSTHAMQASAQAGPLVSLDEAWTYLEAEYATPVPGIDPMSGQAGTIAREGVRLARCTGIADVGPGFLEARREITAPGGVDVVARFWWPPAPTGATAGYTAPLVAWIETRITGLAAEPIVLTSDWAQTYRPGHHNFFEDFLFEPGLDPSVPAGQVAELAAKDIRAIAVPWLYDPAPGQGAWIVGLDGTLRAWK